MPPQLVTKYNNTILSVDCRSDLYSYKMYFPVYGHGFCRKKPHLPTGTDFGTIVKCLTNRSRFVAAKFFY